MLPNDALSKNLAEKSKNLAELPKNLVEKSIFLSENLCGSDLNVPVFVFYLSTINIIFLGTSHGINNSQPPLPSTFSMEVVHTLLLKNHLKGA